MVRAMKLVCISASALVAALVLGTAACGGSTPPPATPSETTGAAPKNEGEHEHEHEHGAISPALKDFHGVLGPVWHSDAGAVRVEKACTNAKALQDKAKATGDADLIAAAAALDPACAASGRPDVEAKLTVVHERFHALVEKK
jgi:hypothetical protein